MAKKSGLNAKQKRFIDEYLVDSNATEAAIRAGYAKKTARQQGSRLLSHVDIQAEIKKRREGVSRLADVQLADVVLQLSRMALFDPRKMYDEGGNPLPIQELPDEAAMVIQGFKVRKEFSAGDGEPATILEYKMADRNSAADKLMKHLGGYEVDNKQKGDGLAELMREIAGSAGVLDKARERSSN